MRGQARLEGGIWRSSVEEGKTRVSAKALSTRGASSFPKESENSSRSLKEEVTTAGNPWGKWAGLDCRVPVPWELEDWAGHFPFAAQGYRQPRGLSTLTRHPDPPPGRSTPDFLSAWAVAWLRA